MSLEDRIKDSLLSLLAGIRAADGNVVAGEMTRLEELLETGRASLHPQLVHFLQNRSYPKALMFLGGESDIPAGTCGGGKGRG